MVSASHLDHSLIQQIRSQFPALERRAGGNVVAYFDGPGGTQVPRVVVEAMSDYLFHHNANTHWAYPTSEETDAAITGAREACADFLNASANEIAFGANMTTLTFHLSRALGASLRPNDEIVVTELDHHANIAPWQQLSIERGIKLRWVQMDPESGTLDWQTFEEALNSHTRLIAIGAASNALGTVNDIARAIAGAKSVGALSFIDAVHYAPHRLVDVRSLDCDFLALSAYKFYGPHIGVMFGKQELLDSISFPKLQPAPDEAPENVETGTQNQEGMVGTRAAIDFLASLGEGHTRRERLHDSFERLHRRGAELINTLWCGLEAIPGIRLFGPPPTAERTPTISFVVEGIASTEVARSLAQQGLFLSHGDFYAATVTERLNLGTEGLVRAGCACYTTSDEVERLIEACAQLGK